MDRARRDRARAHRLGPGRRRAGPRRADRRPARLGPRQGLRLAARAGPRHDRRGPGDGRDERRGDLCFRAGASRNVHGLLLQERLRTAGPAERRRVAGAGERARRGARGRGGRAGRVSRDRDRPRARRRRGAPRDPRGGDLRPGRGLLRADPQVRGLGRRGRAEARRGNLGRGREVRHGEGPERPLHGRDAQRGEDPERGPAPARRADGPLPDGHGRKRDGAQDLHAGPAGGLHGGRGGHQDAVRARGAPAQHLDRLRDQHAGDGERRFPHLCRRRGGRVRHGGGPPRAARGGGGAPAPAPQVLPASLARGPGARRRATTAWCGRSIP